MNTMREKTAEAMAAYWDKSAPNYESRHELADKPVWQSLLAGWIGPDRGAKIVDVATGTGMIAHMLAAYGYRDVTGVDLSEGMMEVARRHASEDGLSVTYRRANALELPFEDGSVDALVSSRLLWTLPEPENAVREWLRVLKPGGRLIAINELEETGIRSHSFDDPATYIGAEFTERDFTFANASREAILEAFRRAGLRNVRLEHMKGCHMVKSDRENWFAFVGTKE